MQWWPVIRHALLAESAEQFGPPTRKLDSNRPPLRVRRQNLRPLDCPYGRRCRPGQTPEHYLSRRRRYQRRPARPPQHNQTSYTTTLKSCHYGIILMFNVEANDEAPWAKLLSCHAPPTALKVLGRQAAVALPVHFDTMASVALFRISSADCGTIDHRQRMACWPRLAQRLRIRIAE